MKKILSIILILSITLLTGCSGKDKNEQQFNFKGEFTTYMYTPDSMNPLVTAYKTNAQILSVMYSPLFKVKGNLELEPVVAKKYGFYDSKTLEITIRDDIIFSDGSPLTSDDVIKSLDVISKCKKNMYHSIFDYVDDYYKNDSHSLTLKLKSGGSSVLPHLDFPIVKEGTKKIGSGPYNYVSRDNDKMIMTASKTTKTLTKTKTITVNIFSKEKMQNSAFVNNEIDVVNTELYDLAQFSSKKNTNIKEYTSDYFTFMAFNNEKITDINVKKAVAYSIDKDDLTSTILVGHAIKTASPYRPKTMYDTTQIYDYKLNKEKVLEFLKRSKLTPSDITYSILVNNETNSKLKTAEYIASRLNEVGMNITVTSVDFDTYKSRITNSDYDMFIGEILMPESYDLSFLLTEENILNYNNDTITEYINKINYSAYDDRPKAAKDLTKLLLNKLPFISLYFRQNMLVTSNNVYGAFDISPENIYFDITDWEGK